MDAVVCGIDPGLRLTGYAVVERGESGVAVREAGVCRLDTRTTLTERLVHLDEDIAGLLREHRPSLVAVEQLYSHYRHPQTAILMGHARGVILLCAARAGIRVAHYASAHVKRFLTGNGQASKVQVQRAVAATLGLDVPPDPPDVADALAIALCALHAHDAAATGEAVADEVAPEGAVLEGRP
jgi:crossover junction endodeoxyribonuclease RuvC